MNQEKWYFWKRGREEFAGENELERSGSSFSPATPPAGEGSAESPCVSNPADPPSAEGAAKAEPVAAEAPLPDTQPDSDAATVLDGEQLASLDDGGDHGDADSQPADPGDGDADGSPTRLPDDEGDDGPYVGDTSEWEEDEPLPMPPNLVGASGARCRSRRNGRRCHSLRSRSCYCWIRGRGAGCRRGTSGRWSTSPDIPSMRGSTASSNSGRPD